MRNGFRVSLEYGQVLPARHRGFTIAPTNAAVYFPVAGFPTQSIGAQWVNTLSTVSFTTTGQFQFTGLDLSLAGTDTVLMPGPVTAQGFVGAMLVGTDVFAGPVIHSTPTAYGAVNLRG